MYVGSSLRVSNNKGYRAPLYCMQIDYVKLHLEWCCNPPGP
jgi:hypothetical protein